MSQPSTTDGGRGPFGFVQLLAVVAILSLLFAVVSPVILKGRSVGREQECASNLFQIGKAYGRAMNRTDVRLKFGADWYVQLQGYLGKDARIFHCPEHDGQDVTDSTVSYGMNNRADLLSSGEKIVMLDYKKTVANYVGPPVDEGENWRDVYDDYPSLIAPRHHGRINVLHRDGRVESWAPDEINPVNCFLYRKYWLPSRATGFDRHCTMTDESVETP